MKKKYKNIETGKWIERDESNSIIIKYTPEECTNKKLREKKFDEIEKKLDKFEKTFSDTEEEEEGDDNSEET